MMAASALCGASAVTALQILSAGHGNRAIETLRRFSSAKKEGLSLISK